MYLGCASCATPDNDNAVEQVLLAVPCYCPYDTSYMMQRGFCAPRPTRIPEGGWMVKRISMTCSLIARGAAGREPTRHQAGFTIIELVVCIVLIGILSAVAYPRLMSSGYDEVGFRDQVASTLAFARKSAVAQRRNVQVSLSGNILRFRVTNAPSESGAASELFDGAAGRDLILPGSSLAYIKPQGNSALAGPATLVFDPLGRATALSYTYTINGGRTLQVDKLTGYVY